MDEKYARQAADAAGIKPIRADTLVKIIASMSRPSPKAKAEESSAVAMHLINDFKMNAKVNPTNSSFECYYLSLSLSLSPTFLVSFFLSLFYCISVFFFPNISSI